MSNQAQWLIDLGQDATSTTVDGLVLVEAYQRQGRPPEEVAIMDKAEKYGAYAVFFEAERKGRPSVAQAFVFVSDGQVSDSQFAELHQRLWSWGGVPLLYRKMPGLVQLFRCAHKPDFVAASGELVCKPVKILKLGTAISADPWWNGEQLRNGTLWDDREACKTLLSNRKSAHKGLIDAIRNLSDQLDTEGILPKHLRRKLLILSLLIAYLEEREVFKDGYLGRFLWGANKFFQVLADGEALVALLDALEIRFNGNVFSLEDADRERLRNSNQLARFAKLIEGRETESGQLTLWQLYSFKDLPVELISHIYQLFVKDADSSVYTPPFLVRLMLEESLSWERLDRIHQRGEVILDPCCGSGVFLVEAYKRLVLHWRSRNEWKRPSVTVLKGFLNRLHGIDLEAGAVELAGFSLCLALCDALEPAEIRASVKLFPPLAGKTLHHSCFFEAKEQGLVKYPIGVVVGNPPFTSSLSTPGAERSYKDYQSNHGSLPDKQLAYLFLHESMKMVAEGGVLGMLQQYNFLYNQQSLGFRRHFIANWDVREILDFISLRGLFQKGGADTKIIVVVAEAVKPKAGRKILHAVFRRSGRADAEQGFDIDYYDLHWLSRNLVISNDKIWRSNLFGGGRLVELIDWFRKFRTLKEYAETESWDYGEGFIEGGSGISVPADHIIGKPLLPSEALTSRGIDVSNISIAKNKPYERPRSEKRFSPPMLLIREHIDIQHDVWTKNYLTYSKRIVGFCAPQADTYKLQKISKWLSGSKKALKAYIALTSPSLVTAKATAIQAVDIFSIPYPETENLDLSSNEQVLVEDVVDYYFDLIRLGESSEAMKMDGQKALPDFGRAFTQQINTVYKGNPLRVLEAQTWSGIICQPFVFGKGAVDWSNATELQGKVNTLLQEQKGETLRVTRIARIYDGNFIFLLKPDRLRYWLRSIALRDADETLADLRAQGF